MSNGARFFAQALRLARLAHRQRQPAGVGSVTEPGVAAGVLSVVSLMRRASFAVTMSSTAYRRTGSVLFAYAGAMT
jgi:hypothetical protein